MQSPAVNEATEKAKEVKSNALKEAEKVLRDKVTPAVLLAKGMDDGGSWKLGLNEDADWTQIKKAANKKGGLLSDRGSERAQIKENLGKAAS